MPLRLALSSIEPDMVKESVNNVEDEKWLTDVIKYCPIENEKQLDKWLKSSQALISQYDEKMEG